MANFNKVILMGNLTRDPQLKYLPSNTAVCEFGLAVNRKWRDRDGNLKDETCFVEVSAFARQAENINQYMAKGRAILVEGRLRYDSWTGQDGQKRSKLSVIAETFQFVGGRDAGAGGGSSGGGQRYEPSSAPPSAPPEDNQYHSEPAGSDPGPPGPDDIPF
ncbi:MAG: single-stranded DNA-binding protein [Planctomycetota bacterium]